MKRLMCCRIAVVSALGMAAALMTVAPASAQPSAPPAWRLQKTPSPGDSANLAGVSCPTAARCVAVGRGPTQLAESWSGTTWKVDRTGPAPAGATTTSLLSVSCPSSDYCVAVGSYFIDNGEGSRNVVFTEVLAHGRWTRQRVANLGGDLDSELLGVSCVSSTYCVAVGDGGPGDLVSEVWNGTTWRALPAVQVAGALPLLEGVSCSAVGQCTAVGVNPLPRRSLPLAERLSGSSWSLERVPVPSGSARGASELLSVSCPTAKRCFAGGDTAHNPSGIHQRIMAETWNGSTWSLQRTAALSGSTQSDWSGESCVSATSCWAVGVNDGTGAIRLPLAEGWNGRDWSLEKVAAPAEKVQTALVAVSCATRPVCTAVGSALVLKNDDVLTVAERN